jgi:hypothetical protein
MKLSSIRNITTYACMMMKMTKYDELLGSSGILQIEREVLDHSIR